MDPALLSYLTVNQMISEQFGIPALQTGTVPINVQASNFLQSATPSQLISMDQHFKPAAMAEATSPELLLQILNNNSFATVSIAPQLTLAPLAVAKQQPQPPQALLSLFEQLVAAQQGAAIQQPLFVDHASAFAALSVHSTQQVIAATPPNIAGMLPLPSVDTLNPMLQQPSILRPRESHGTARTVPVITIDASEMKSSVPESRSGATVQNTATSSFLTSAIPQLASPIKPEASNDPFVRLPAKASHSCHSETSWLQEVAAAAVASTSKSSSVDDEAESILSGEEEERFRPEDIFAGRQRRADHIAFHRKMKALLKSLRGSDLICKLCSVKVDRHDNAFKTHIAEHATNGANQLECRYCGYETPSRVEMNIHMGERHPNGSERAYTDKRDHLKMIEIMNECFAKIPRPIPKPKKDPALVKPRMSRKRRLAAEEALAVPETAVDDAVGNESFESVIVRFCTEKKSKEVKCACGDEVILDPSALLTHIKTLHARYRCSDCGDPLASPVAAREHTVKMHGGDSRTYADRIVDYLLVRSMHERFMACFIKKDSSLAKSHSVQVLRMQMVEELERVLTGDNQEEVTTHVKLEPTDIKEEPVDIKEEPVGITEEPGAT